MALACGQYNVRLISILIIDCIYLSACKIFTFQLENDLRAVKTSLLFNFNFFLVKSVSKNFLIYLNPNWIRGNKVFAKKVHNTNQNWFK